ncbi:MAG: HAD-IA family hydrolase [Succinivibrio sp.]
MIFWKGRGPVRAVSFDLDDTLYDNQPVIASAEARFSRYIMERYGLGPEVLDEGYWMRWSDWCISSFPELDNDVTLLREQMLLHSLSELGHPISRGEARELVRHFIRIRSEITVPEGSLRLLCDLKEKYPLACVSNGNSDIRQDGLCRYFDYDLRPSAKGPRCKPNPDLFLQFASLAGVRPCQVLHVGDDPFTDVLGAESAGCQSAWLERGIAGKTAGADSLRILPDVQLSSLDELRAILL